MTNLTKKHVTSTHLRAGMTLVELMVAITVISLLAAVSLPTIKNSLREQKISRAASLLRSAIEEGRARAIVNGGGGVIIDRLGIDSIEGRSSSNQIRFAKVPRPYTGDFGIGQATVVVDDRTLVDDPVDDVIYLDFFSNDSPQMVRSELDYDAARNATPPRDAETLINVGDTLFLGEAGLPLRIVDMADFPISLPTRPVPYIRVQVERENRNLSLLRFNESRQQYSIHRRPKPALAMPVTLPKDTLIDLTVSGIGRYGNQFSPMAITGNYTDESIAPYPAGDLDYGSIVILFGERGAVSDVLLTRRDDVPISLDVTGDIHLLIGRGGEVKSDPLGQLEDSDTDPFKDAANDGTTPLLDPESIWVTIKSRTGSVVTSSWVDPTDETISLIVGPNGATTNPNQRQQDRVQAVIGLVRTAAATSLDSGSN